MSKATPDREAAMTLERLRTVLGTYGASPAHWPHGERAAAEALIDSSRDARALVSEAAQLDALLDLVQPPAPSTALAQRIHNRRFGWRGFRFVSFGERFAADGRRWMLNPRHQVVAICGALAIGLLVGSEIAGDAVTTSLPAHTASAERSAASLRLEPMAPLSVDRMAIMAAAEPLFSSIGDPSFDAPDPFGAASHGIDLVNGARINGVPVPASGEPLGSIPLL